MQDSVTEPAATARTHASSPATLRITFKTYIRAFQRVPHRLQPGAMVPRSLIPTHRVDECCSCFSRVSPVSSVHARSCLRR
jgi:hypothetical protein